MIRILLVSAMVTSSCVATGVLAQDRPRTPGGGFDTSIQASGGKSNDAHFDGKGRTGPLANPARGTVPSGDLAGFGHCTAKAC